MAESSYPPDAFYFAVNLASESATSGSVNNSFQEVSGISTALETDQINEGGENTFVHSLPKKPNYDNLVLKRGLILADGPFARWCLNVMQVGLAQPIETKTVGLWLLADEGGPQMSWIFYDAWPVKMQVSDLSAALGHLAVETLEISYTHFETKKLN